MNYKLFGKSGLRVSEISLGTMTFGEEWALGTSADESKNIFDAYANLGGNFIDTANRYTEGSSEKILKDLIAKDRDHFVIASKYTLYDNKTNPNASGNSRKNMMRSVEGSLNRLGTDFLDILWVHAWDFTTPVEEVMRGLDDLVRQGKVNYVGISDTPAWIVSKANTLAELRGWSAFVGLQIEYSLIQRTPERDLLPMAKHFDMAVTPWSPLGAGILTGKYNHGMIDGGRLTEKSVKFNTRNIQIAQAVEEVAQEIGATSSEVALQWILSQDARMIPIVGARNATQLTESLQCLGIQLEQKHLEKLNEISQIEMGFPHDFLASPNVKDIVFGGYDEKIIR